MVADVAGKHCIGDTLTMADLCLVPQLLNAKRYTSYVFLKELPTSK